MKKLAVLLATLNACCFLYGTQVSLTIELGLNKGSEEMIVDKDVEFLSFGKPSYVSSIKGLGKLRNLKTLIFERTAFIKDFSFLAEAKTVEHLVLCSVDIRSLDFLAELGNLKSLVITSCYTVDGIALDVAANPKLEYIDLSRNRLTELPPIVNPGGRFKFLNVSYNDIATITARNRGYRIFAAGNPVAEHGNMNGIIFDPDFKKYLPADISRLYSHFDY